MSRRTDVGREHSSKLEVLSKIGHKLNEAKVTWAIGGSLLLYFMNKTDCFHDIDVMIAVKDAPTVKDILLQMGTLVPEKPNSLFKTTNFMRFMVDDLEVDIMPGMIICRDGIDHECVLKTEDIVDYEYINGVRIPLHSLKEWRKYYALMGREDKVNMIEG